MNLLSYLNSKGLILDNCDYDRSVYLNPRFGLGITKQENYTSWVEWTDIDSSIQDSYDFIFHNHSCSIREYDNGWRSIGGPRNIDFNDLISNPNHIEITSGTWFEITLDDISKIKIF